MNAISITLFHIYLYAAFCHQQKQHLPMQSFAMKTTLCGHQLKKFVQIQCAMCER